MIYIQIILLVLIISFTFFYVIWLWNNIKYKVPQVSTFNSDLKLLKNVFDKYNLQQKSIVDLWSGTWKMIRLFEKEYNMKTTWFEIDFLNVIVSKILAKLYNLKSSSTRKNYFSADLWEFDFIYTYLFPVLMENIEKKIWSECKKGTIIFVNAFPFKKHTPIKIFQKNWKDKIFVYEI